LTRSWEEKSEVSLAKSWRVGKGGDRHKVAKCEKKGKPEKEEVTRIAGIEGKKKGGQMLGQRTMVKPDLRTSFQGRMMEGEKQW